MCQVFRKEEPGWSQIATTCLNMKTINRKDRKDHKEFASLRFQAGTSKDEPGIRFQTGTASKRNVRYLPYVFTEHGAIMAANIFRSP